jgi:polysaccharide pyruvyl transferase CsaB
MKILMTTMKLDIGGAETHIVELCGELRRRGHEIVVASNGGVYVNELERQGIRHVKLPLHTKRISSVIRSYFGLKKLIKTERFDIVHAHARIPAFICGALSKKLGFRFMTSAHWVFKVNTLWKMIADWGERSVAVSYDIKQYLIENYGVCSDNISVTINGIDIGKFSGETDAAPFIDELGLDKSARRVVCVSRIDRDRSLAPILLCKAAPGLKKRFPELEVVIVGSGDDFSRLKAAADEANNASDKPYVKLCGSRTDINLAIASADVFVGVSRAALEAMAAQKPCVLAGNEGYLGIFDESKLSAAFDTNFCCRGCEQTTAEALERDISALLSADEKTLADMGAYNRSIIQRHYSVSRMTDDYEAAYQKLKPYHPHKEGGIILSGYYGYRNSGDDALLGVIVGAIRNELSDVGIAALSRMPAQTSRRYGIESIGRYNVIKINRLMKRSKLFVNGGGTLLTNSMTSTRSLWYYTSLMRLAKRRGLGVMLYANGVGPVEGEYGAKLARNALEECDVISLREELSHAELDRLGVKNKNVVVTADPAFMLSPCDGDWLRYLLTREGFLPDRQYVCFALRRCEGLSSGFEGEIKKACSELREKYGLIPAFIAMQRPNDVGLARSLAASTGGLFISELTAPELIGLISACRFTVGMRLHSLIYSAVAGTPVIPVSYDVKVDALVESLNSASDERGSITPIQAQSLTAGALIQQAERVIANRDAMAAQITSTARSLAGVARESAKLLGELWRGYK